MNQHDAFEAWINTPPKRYTGLSDGWTEMQKEDDVEAFNAGWQAALVHVSPRPEYGGVGSRDVDVAAAQKVWDDAQKESQLIDFDTWSAHPYTKVLEKAIAEDYVPKADFQRLENWKKEGEQIFETTPLLFKMGEWWADRPWRKMKQPKDKS